MTFFPDTVLKRYAYTHQKSGLYGETVHEYEYVGDISCDFQNESNIELAKEYGVELQNLYKIYVNINVALDDTDELRDSEGNKYHIIGNIQKYPKFHKYKKAHIVLERA